MLEDELFSKDENMLIDEVITMIIASTQTNKVSLYTLLYYLTT